MSNWHNFPHDNSTFGFEGGALDAAWPELHRGDCIDFPDADHVREWLEGSPEVAPQAFDGDVQVLAEALQSAWRNFHRGNFEEAVVIADSCGALGHAPANKACGIYATYLEPDETRQRSCFMNAVARAEAAIEVLADDPNTHYFHAFNLGRYSQSISVVEALRRGIGGKIMASLKIALELEPEHAEAHTALGMYHAEIINKVGKMIGGMTYGANAGKAVEHFERAIELTPDAPIAHIEFGNGLYLLFGDRRLDDVTDLYVRAAEMTPRDAMENLDVEAALAELE